MLGHARLLALEVEEIEPAGKFYEETLGLPVKAAGDDERVFGAGDSSIALRSVGALPRGGAHVHFAVSVSPDEYDEWYERLGSVTDLEERTFGGARSLYCFDPAGHCVELGERGEGPGIGGIFEIVLEVTDLEAATERYRSLGFSVVDRGEDRRRVRLTTDAFDLELWEPQYGIAGARGGDHVDFAVQTDDPAAIVDGLDGDEWRTSVTHTGRIRLRDCDGHCVTLCTG